MRFVLYLTTSLFCMLPAMAHSQDAIVEPHAIAGQCLPIGTVIDLARKNSPDAGIARAQIGESEADITAAKKFIFTAIFGICAVRRG